MLSKDYSFQHSYYTCRLSRFNGDIVKKEVAGHIIVQVWMKASRRRKQFVDPHIAVREY